MAIHSCRVVEATKKHQKSQYLNVLNHETEKERKYVVFASNNIIQVKNIITPTEAIDYFVLSRRKFYDLLKSDEQKNFLVFYKERKMIIRTAFARYLEAHPDLRRRC